MSLRSPKPTNSQKSRVVAIIAKMYVMNFSTKICRLIERYYQDYQGLCDLIEMWDEEDDQQSKQVVLTDIFDALHDLEFHLH